MSDFPDCPECDTDAFVDRSNTGKRDFRCWLCNVYWEQSRAGNEWGVPSNIADAPVTGRV